MSSNATKTPGKLGSRLSIWQNAIHSTQTTLTKQKLTKGPKKIIKTWKPTNGPHEHPNTKQNRSKSIDVGRLNYFTHSGEKYFKILIDSLMLYKDKTLQILSQQNDLIKDDIVHGTYITNKIVLFGEPYNLYCDSRYVEPVDINHSVYLQHQKQKQNKNDEYSENKESKQNNNDKSMLTCDVNEVITPEIPQEPMKDCRAYFTGVYMGCDLNCKQNGVGIPYKVDIYSEYVGSGAYPKNTVAFPKAVASTFDGIAIDRNTRVIIWEKENFEGEILLDQVGPALIHNIYAKENYPDLLSYKYTDMEIENNFPSHTRMWSKSNMHSWSYGSVKVVATKQ